MKSLAKELDIAELGLSKDFEWSFGTTDKDIFVKIYDILRRDMATAGLGDVIGSHVRMHLLIGKGWVI